MKLFLSIFSFIIPFSPIISNNELISNQFFRANYISKNFNNTLIDFTNHNSVRINTLGNGRRYPIIPSNPRKLSDLIIYLENTTRDPRIDPEILQKHAHKQQVIYRVLSRNKKLTDQILDLLPLKYRSIAEIHISARREFVEMSKNSFKKNIPAWNIVKPESLQSLLLYYLKAEESTGIDWEILAAINLVETGFGRIDGVSIANAQGPMQFLPSTWNEPGIGQGGDIRDPFDSIQAAARYLVRRGGLEDIRKGLWGYNNSDNYGRAVMLYADLLRSDPLAFVGLYHWQIHFNANGLDLWLPEGYSSNIEIPISTYIKEVPISTPPDYSLYK